MKRKRLRKLDGVRKDMGEGRRYQEQETLGGEFKILACERKKKLKK